MNRTAAAEATVDSRRMRIEELVCDLPGARDGERAFDEPWQIRAFALAVGAHQACEFEWSAFQSALIDSINRWEQEAGDEADSRWSYYHHWLYALERVLENEKAINASDLDARTADVLATPVDRHHQKAQLEPVAIDRVR